MINVFSCVDSLRPSVKVYVANLGSAQATFGKWENHTKICEHFIAAHYTEILNILYTI